MMRRSSSPGCAAFSVVVGIFMRASPFAGTSSVCVFRQSLGSNVGLVCASTTIVSTTKTQKLWSRRDRSVRFIAFRGCSKKPLIQKRRHNCDYRDGDERADAIKLIKLRKIVKEKFQNGDA